jgi:hypothetical protein
MKGSKRSVKRKTLFFMTIVYGIVVGNNIFYNNGRTWVLLHFRYGSAVPQQPLKNVIISGCHSSFHHRFGQVISLLI